MKYILLIAIIAVLAQTIESRYLQRNSLFATDVGPRSIYLPDFFYPPRFSFDPFHSVVLAQRVGEAKYRLAYDNERLKINAGILDRVLETLDQMHDAIDDTKKEFEILIILKENLENLENEEAAEMAEIAEEVEKVTSSVKDVNKEVTPKKELTKQNEEASEGDEDGEGGDEGNEGNEGEEGDDKGDEGDDEDDDWSNAFVSGVF